MPEVRELLNLAAPVALTVDGDTDSLERVSVKGFASVMSKNDRSGDLVPPEEFRIAQFMASPTLLVNHRFWTDAYGNSVAVGRPVKMHAAKLVDLGERDQKNWGVLDLETRKQVNLFPRDKIPNLRAGDRGLFVVCDVTEPEVVKRVRAGEFSAFSWRGLTSVTYEVDGRSGMTQRVFKDIDLFEISLTHIPDNPDSTFVVGKSVDGSIEPLAEQLALYRVSLERSRFENREQAAEYAKTHHFAFDDVQEDSEAFHAFQQPHHQFDLERLVSLKLANGVRVVAGPLKPADALTWSARELTEAEKSSIESSRSDDETPSVMEGEGVETEPAADGLLSGVLERICAVSKSNTEEVVAMATATKTKAAEVEATAVETEVEEKAAAKAGDGGGGSASASSCPEGQMYDEAAGKCVPAEVVEKSVDEAAIETLSERVAEGVVNGLQPIFAGLTDAMKSGLTEIAEKMATTTQPETVAEAATDVASEASAEADDETEEETEEKTEEATATEDATDSAETEAGDDSKEEAAKSVDGLGTMLKSLADGLVAVTQKVEEVKKSNEALAKAAPDVTERDEKIEAAKGSDDPNSCFDNLWTFMR